MPAGSVLLLPEELAIRAEQLKQPFGNALLPLPEAAARSISTRSRGLHLPRVYTLNCCLLIREQTCGVKQAYLAV